MILLKKYHTKIKEFLISHENFSAALFFILLITIFFFPVIFQGKTLTTSVLSPGVMTNGPYEYNGTRPPMFTVRDPGAFNWQDEPLSQFIGNVIKNDHGVPLWNPNMGLGYPILGAFHLGIFSLLNFPVFLFSNELTWDIMILFKFFLAGFFTYLFTRKIKLEKGPSLLAGVVFMFSGYLLSYLNMPHFSIEIVIPLLLLSYEYFLEKQNFKRLLLCIGTNLLIMVPGMPESIFFAFMLGGGWFLFSLIFLHKNLAKRAKIFSLIGIISAGIISLLVTSIQLLPFLELLGLSLNMHSKTNIGLSFISFGTVSAIFFPYLFNPVNSYEGTVTYLGITPVVLALLGILSLRSFNNRQKRISIFFALFVLLGLGKIFGLFLINWVGSLPILNTLIFPKYLVPEITFAVAILSAQGCSLISKKTVRYLNTKLALIFLTILGLITYTFREKNVEFAEKLKNNDQVIKNLIDYFWPLLHLKIPNQFLESVKSSPTILYFILVILLGLFIYLIFWILLINLNYRDNKKKYFSVLILFFVTLELLIYVLPLVRGNRCDTFKEPPFVRYLESDNTDNFRIYSQSNLIFPNISSVFDIQDIRFLIALSIGRYSEFLRNVLGVSGAELNTVRFTGESNLDLKDKYLSLLNVKYLLTDPNGSQDPFVKNIIEKGNIISGNENIKMSSGSLGGIPLSGLLMHAPSKIEFPITVQENNKNLSFDYGIADTGIKGSNGVRFVVDYQCGGKEKEVLNDLVDPTNNKYQSWQKTNLDFSDCMGKEAKLTFDSENNGNNAFDHFFVGDFSSSENDIVYNKEVKINYNPDYMPRVFVVHKAEAIFDPEKIFAELKNPDFDIGKEIIIEKDLPKDKLITENVPADDQSKAEITSYKNEKVMINANMENPGFLVLLDQYYPGWKAYVDGKETEIYPADYTFRSIYLDKGNHKVEFIYDPLSYKIGKYVTLATILLLIIAFVFREKIDKRIFNQHS